MNQRIKRNIRNRTKTKYKRWRIMIMVLSALSLGATIGIGVGVGVVVIGGITYVAMSISIKNKFVESEVLIDESFSTMDVYLKKRHDLIPNLVETVKGYAKHESATLEAVVAARNTARTAVGGARAEAEGALDNVCGRLMMMQETYPALKADTQFIMLQRELGEIEDEISQARSYYNATVKKFNTEIRKFPGSHFASKMKLEQRPFFEAQVAERENVKVTF